MKIFLLAMHSNVYSMYLILMVNLFLFKIIFSIVLSSLDNKQLDRQEYNLWTIRTTGEEITDEDWASIRGKIFYKFQTKMILSFYNLETVQLDVDEIISKEKFLRLNDFEVQDPDTTEQDLWIGLKSVGFNYALELDMVC